MYCTFYFGTAKHSVTNYLSFLIEILFYMTLLSNYYTCLILLFSTVFLIRAQLTVLYVYFFFFFNYHNSKVKVCITVKAVFWNVIFTLHLDSVLDIEQSLCRLVQLLHFRIVEILTDYVGQSVGS